MIEFIKGCFYFTLAAVVVIAAIVVGIAISAILGIFASVFYVFILIIFVTMVIKDIAEEDKP